MNPSLPLRTVDSVIANLRRPEVSPLDAPLYIDTVEDREPRKVALAVEQMRRHTTDEGWQLMLALELEGYRLTGSNIQGSNLTDCRDILPLYNPDILVMQDKREWDPCANARNDSKGMFHNTNFLYRLDKVFKLTVLKDAHQNPNYHRRSAADINCHAWITYYHPRIVKHLAPYVREEHLIRTYHTVDKSVVPPYSAERPGNVLLSGAVSAVYPLRRRIVNSLTGGDPTLIDWKVHPGYKPQGCKTPELLQVMSKYKVAICTSSIYGYSLRKIVEATAAGCRVVTDLPTDDILPHIDSNLIRISPDTPIEELRALLERLCETYDSSFQETLALVAKEHYDYRTEGTRLAKAIEEMRIGYNRPRTEPVTVTVVKEPIVNEQEALKVMVPPSQHRPNKMGRFGGVMQIWITRSCDKSCFACTQGSNLRIEDPAKARISVEQFERACISVVDYFGVVGMFGGNPAVHPDFEELCKIMRKYIPYERRGIWCNNPLGNGKVMAETFNPSVSNLNVHLDKAAYDEFKRDWPTSNPFGLDKDSRHSPPYVAMKDVIDDEAKRWGLIANCDINKHWSAMIGVFRGNLRGYFCEIAGAQAMLHQNEPDYPDTGVPALPGWWKKPMVDFAPQVRKHCHECGIPLRGYGELAQRQDGGVEQVSMTHVAVYNSKRRRTVEVVTDVQQLGIGRLQKVTDYVGNASK